MEYVFQEKFLFQKRVQFTDFVPNNQFTDLIRPQKSLSQQLNLQLQILILLQSVYVRTLTQQFQKAASSQNTTFQCPCGKAYKSSSALSTHIKMKHPNQKEEFRKGSIKPQLKQKRGRPKNQHKEPMKEELESQMELLTLFELTTISLMETLKKKGGFKEKTILLQGNENLDLTQIQNQLLPFSPLSPFLQSFFQDPLPLPHAHLPTLCLHFCRKLFKHFSPCISSQVLLFFNLLVQSQPESEGEELDLTFFNEFMTNVFVGRQQGFKEVGGEEFFEQVLVAFGNFVHCLGFSRRRVGINMER